MSAWRADRWLGSFSLFEMWNSQVAFVSSLSVRSVKPTHHTLVGAVIPVIRIIRPPTGFCVGLPAETDEGESVNIPL